MNHLRSRDEFERYRASQVFAERQELELHLARRHRHEESFFLPGFCRFCRQAVDFAVDRLWGAQEIEPGLWLPNWRERLDCPKCRLNNRQRALAAVALAELQKRVAPTLYVMEQVTWMFQALQAQLPAGATLIGSEYLGLDKVGGRIYDGLRHEDAEALSLETGSVDVVLSNDVFEHVALPERGFAEVARVLRTGGRFFFSVPFFSQADQSVTRSRRHGQEIDFLLPPVYHGDPLSGGHSLVFTDFGWDLLDQVRTFFSDCEVVLTWNFEYCHLSAENLFFEAVR